MVMRGRGRRMDGAGGWEWKRTNVEEGLWLPLLGAGPLEGWCSGAGWRWSATVNLLGALLC